MEHDILKDAWKIKDQIAIEYAFDIDSIANALIKKEKQHQKDIVNYSRKAKKAA